MALYKFTYLLSVYVHLCSAFKANTWYSTMICSCVGWVIDDVLAGAMLSMAGGPPGPVHVIPGGLPPPCHLPLPVSAPHINPAFVSAASSSALLPSVGAVSTASCVRRAVCNVIQGCRHSGTTQLSSTLPAKHCISIMCSFVLYKLCTPVCTVWASGL